VRRLTSRLVALFRSRQSEAPAWSPDGWKIAFDSNREGTFAIYVMNSDGNDQRRLTPAGPRLAGYPAWSPDGQKIAFENYSPGAIEICTIDADGGPVECLTEKSESASGFPAWSRDGRKIAFQSNRDGPAHHDQIYVMEADGGMQVRLLTSDYDDQHPAWSPDGGKLTFDRTEGGESDVFVMDAHGQGLARLTHDGMSGGRGGAAWSPDGKAIAFHSSRDGDAIYIVNAEGGDQRRLTRTSRGFHAFSSHMVTRRNEDRISRRSGTPARHPRHGRRRWTSAPTDPVANSLGNGRDLRTSRSHPSRGPRIGLCPFLAARLPVS
jgi:Tol biopolymer transport system component